MRVNSQRPGNIPPRIEPTSVFTGLKIRPIVAGVAVDYVATYVAMYAWIINFVSKQLSEQGELSEEAIQTFLASPEGLLIGFVIGTLGTVLGGFVAGRMAKNLEIKHGAFVGAGSLMVSALEQAMSGNGASLPQWYVVMSSLAIVPAGALGAYIAQRLRQLRADDRTPAAKWPDLKPPFGRLS